MDSEHETNTGNVVLCAQASDSLTLRSRALNNPIAITEELLTEVLRRIRELNPGECEAPRDETSKKLRYLGTATDTQKVLFTALENAHVEHTALHRQTGLVPGVHTGLPLEHRKLHNIINIIDDLLREDLPNTFEGLGERGYFIDKDWNVYAIEPSLSERIKRIIRRFI